MGVISTVLTTTGQSRITSLAAFKEAAAGIAGATAVDTGADRGRAIREAGAGFAAIGGAIKDPDGALTKTAVSALAIQLERLLPEKDREISLSEEERAKLTAKREKAKTRLTKLESGGMSEADRAEVEKINAEQADIDKQLSTGRKLDKKHTRLSDTERAALAFKKEKLDQRKEKLEKETISPEQREAETKVLQAEIAQIDQELTEGARRKGTGLKTFDERLKAVQASRQLQLEFWDKLEGEKRASFRGPIAPIIKQLLEDKNSEAAKRYEEAKTKISGDSSSYDQMVKNLQGASTQLKIQEAQSQGTAGVEKFDVTASTASRRQTAEKVTEEALMRTRTGIIGYIGDKARGAANSMAGVMGGPGEEGDSRLGPLIRQRELLSQRRSDLLTKYVPRGEQANFLMSGKTIADAGASDEDVRKMDLIGSADKIVQKMEDEERAAIKAERDKKAKPTGAGTSAMPNDNTVSAAGGDDGGATADLLNKINSTLSGMQQLQERALQNNTNQPASGASALAAATFGAHREMP
jgi:hypothetical protein